MKHAAASRLRLALMAGMALLAACQLYRLERKLDPANAEFLSRVSWIITAQERKVFLELPDAEKPGFIEEFWQRRDPDPESEENEFQVEYEKRVEEAARLFRNESKPGWLTDRGRILILFGPPTDRIVDSMSTDLPGQCREIWYYGNFPVVFTDPNCTGHFNLVTYDLTAISGLNLTYMHALNQAQAEFQQPPSEDKKRFDVRARLVDAKRAADGVRATVLIEVPYDRIWFASEGTKLLTDIEAAVEIRDESQKTVRAWTSVATIGLEESELREKWGKSHAIQVPIAVEAADELLRLGSGRITVAVTVTNRTGNEVSRKLLEFR